MQLYALLWKTYLCLIRVIWIIILTIPFGHNWFQYNLVVVHILWVKCWTYLSTLFRIGIIHIYKVEIVCYYKAFLQAIFFWKEPTFTWLQNYSYSYNYDFYHYLMFSHKILTWIVTLKWFIFNHKPREYSSLLNALKWVINFSFLAGVKQWQMFIRVLCCKYEATTCMRSSNATCISHITPICLNICWSGGIIEECMSINTQ